MPYTGENDPNLPENVKKLPPKRRRQWIHVFDSERGKGRDDGTAIRIANGVVKEDMMDDKETAYAPFDDFEAKADGDSGIVEGYASVFGKRDHGRDRVLPGAFTKTLAERKSNIIYLPTHDYKVHVKDIPAVPLDIKEDSKGLHTTTKFFLDTQAGRDSFRVIKAYQEAKRPIGMSYTFKARDYANTSEGRDLKQVDLYEYGHTALPMLDDARTISAKADSNVMMHSDMIDHMHNHGDMIHSHAHSHDMTNGMYGAQGHTYHNHTADEMKAYPLIEDPDMYWRIDDEAKATFNTAEREKLAKEGVAEKDGSYPIRNATDLENAIKDCNRTGQKPSDVAHIVRRARALGLSDKIPDGWSSGGGKSIFYIATLQPEVKDDENLLKEFEYMIGRDLTETSKSRIRTAFTQLQEALTQEEAYEVNQSEEQKRLEDAARVKREIDEALAKVRI